MASTASAAVEQRERRWRFDRAELAGAVADLGVLVPIAVGLIVTCGLSPTAVLLPAGLLYVVGGLAYRVPVQPLKAFGAIVITQDLGADVIVLGRLARVFPRPIIRGIQLSVGMLPGASARPPLHRPEPAAVFTPAWRPEHTSGAPVTD